MARGLILFPHSKIASQLIITSISRASSSTRREKVSAFAPITLQFYPSVSILSGRLLCSCSTQQHDSVDMGLPKYREAFARRMSMAGLKPQHRIAMGVSGGPDSLALCVLAADWKTDGQNVATAESSEFIDGLLAIVVDHGLRAESKDEAHTVCHQVQNMRIRCEIAHCEWSNGRPKLGHLQEAARDMRYQNLQNICIRHQIGVLLIAHHADDQAELFILRLSRNSGVLGLAGMAFTSQVFTKYPNFNSEALSSHGILLVRPLLEFTKEDMYKICQLAGQKWVEDPTNRSPLFARNRIRISLENFSFTMKSELQAVISACRRTRLRVDQTCYSLINQSVTIMNQGYAIIDLEILNKFEIEDICLSKFVALLVQFISQRHRPVRGGALKLLLEYIRTYPCKTSLTAANCYLCPAPGSKGTKILVCCHVNSSMPSKTVLFEQCSDEGQYCCLSKEVEQIVADGKSHLDQWVADASDVYLTDVISSESVLIESKRLGIISESTYSNIIALQTDEIRQFRSKTKVSERYLNNEVVVACSTLNEEIYLGKVGYFMNRFLVTWEPRKISCNTHVLDQAESDWNLGGDGQHCSCRSCAVGQDEVAKVRHMTDGDWMYLAELSKCQNVGNPLQQEVSSTEVGPATWMTTGCLNYGRLSAQRALLSLKSIPVAARRGLPVLVNSQGLLLSIPSIGFDHCPCLMSSVVFKPRVPLGGGYSSFI